MVPLFIKVSGTGITEGCQVGEYQKGAPVTSTNHRKQIPCLITTMTKLEVKSMPSRNGAFDFIKKPIAINY